MKRAPLVRRVPLRSFTQLARKPIRRKARKAAQDWSPSVRALVRLRSGGVCEARTPVCTLAAGHLHHRLPRRFGDHTPGNALAVCPSCHSYIHDHPKTAYEHGWLLRSAA